MASKGSILIREAAATDAIIKRRILKTEVSFIEAEMISVFH